MRYTTHVCLCEHSRIMSGGHLYGMEGHALVVYSKCICRPANSHVPNRFSGVETKTVNRNAQGGEQRNMKCKPSLSIGACTLFSRPYNPIVPWILALWHISCVESIQFFSFQTTSLYHHHLFIFQPTRTHSISFLPSYM